MRRGTSRHPSTAKACTGAGSAPTASRRSGSTATKNEDPARSRPQPAEYTGGQKAIHHTIEDILERRAPRLSEPDRVRGVREGPGHDRRCPHDLKHLEVISVGRQRARTEVGAEKADDESVEEEKHHPPAHLREIARRKHRYESGGTSLEPLLGLGT